MGRFDSDNTASQWWTSRSMSSPIWITVGVALIGAAAPLGGVVLTHVFQMRDGICSSFDSRYEKIDQLHDNGQILKRLKALVSEKKASGCNSYGDAKRDLEDRLADDKDGASDDTSVGRSVAKNDGSVDGIPPQSIGHEDIGSGSRPAPSPPFPATVEPNEPAAAQPKLTVAIAEPSATLVDTSPALPEATASPLTVTPQSTTFEGQIGDKLSLRRGISYALRPLQYYTTSYAVSDGDVIVSVDGKPQFHCKAGNAFRLYWQQTPDFIAVTYNRGATLTVANTETGAHLGVSDCEPAGG